LLQVTWKTSLLFAIGILYGLLVTHLHDDRRLASVPVSGILKPSYEWKYLVFWGVAAVGLGSALPLVDGFLGRKEADGEQETGEERSSAETVDWNPVVRSIGAFVGIAFAIVGPSSFVVLQECPMY
jgi:hypothetical protein